MYYLFDKKTKTVKETDDAKEFADWLNSDNRIIARTCAGMFIISTYAMGIPHKDSLPEKPLIFETLILLLDGSFVRDEFTGEVLEFHYETYEEAMEDHRLQAARARLMGKLSNE